MILVLGALSLLSCRSAPPPRPQTCEPEVRLMRRPVSLVPLVATSPPLDPQVLSLLRRHFEKQLAASGVFEIVDGDEQKAELLISAVLSDAGTLPGDPIDDFSMDGHGQNRGDWSVRLVAEVRAVSDHHLIAVVGSSVNADAVVTQPTGADIEAALADPRLRRGLLQVVSLAATGLAARFGPGASFEDPAQLDDETLLRRGKDLYAAGAFYDAEAHLRTSLNRSNKNALAASMLGDVYFNRRDYVRAVEAYNLALDLESNRFHDLVLLGNAYFFLMEIERAQKVWQQALRLEPKGPHAKTLRENLRRSKGAGRRIGKGRGLGSKKSASKKTAPKKDPAVLDGDEF